MFALIAVFVHRLGGSGPIWIRDIKLMSLSTVINGYIALHNLDLIRKTPSSSHYRDALQQFLMKSNPLAGSYSERKRFMEAYKKFQQCADQISSELGNQILRGYWSAKPLDFVALGQSDKSADLPVKPETSLVKGQAQEVPLTSVKPF